MTDSNVDDFFGGGTGVPSAKFANVGDAVTGTILDLERRQQTDLDGKPKFWDDNSPMMQLVITLQTDERNAAIEDDDGRRRLYVKGSVKPESRSMTAAIGAAVMEAGQKGAPRPGGKLRITYTGDGPRGKAGFNPPKQYAAQYQAPAPDDFAVAAAAPAKPAAGAFGDDPPF